MRAVIYARYSSDLQREASIEDQVEVCRRYIERQGWTLIRVFEDRALSGGSAMRPDYQKLLIAAGEGRFDVVVCEALDRLGRRLADVAALHDQLSFQNIRLHAASTGEITPMHVGMMGTMAQMYLADLREKTKRGQLGRALKGKIPGGKAFGYDVMPGTAEGAGERRVNDQEAVTVRRIFEAYADGESPRAIAKRLNADGVPGPEGRPWRDTTIRGQADRGTGILNNALYVGRLEWNRCSYVKNPETGKRVARPNPREAWEIVPVPELRIVSDQLWQRVKARQEQLRFEIARTEQGQALNRAHRRKFLLSGLLKCGACGGGYTIVGLDRYGCATQRNMGTCANTATIRRHEIETRVLDGLRHRLLAPDLVKEFMDEFQAEMNRIVKQANADARALRRQLTKVENKIAAMLKAIEDGMYNPSMKKRMTALERRKVELEAAIEAAPEAPNIHLHPNISEIYAQKVARLEEALEEPETKIEAMAIIRSMIDRIVLTPVEDGLRAELHGELAEILAACEAAEGKKKRPGTGVPGSQLSVVAGVGFEPTTFRL